MRNFLHTGRNKNRYVSVAGFSVALIADSGGINTVTIAVNCLPGEASVVSIYVPTQSEKASMSPALPVVGPFFLERWVRWQCAFLLVSTACFWGLYLRQRGALDLASRVDFLGIYVGARLVATGHGAQLYDLPSQWSVEEASIRPLERGKLLPFIYPAYDAILLKPLGKLGVENAIRVWFVLNVVLVCWMAFRLAQLFATGVWSQLAILAACLAWVPLQLTIFHGQMDMLPALGFTEALASLRFGRRWQAGWWSSLALVKPQLMILPVLLLVIWRCWQAVLAILIAVAGIMSVSMVSLGFWIPTYLHFLAHYNRLGATMSLYPIAMQNWRGLACWLFGTDQSRGAFSLILLLSLLSLIAVAFLGLSSAGRQRNGLERAIRLPAEREFQFAMAIVVGLLSSPHLYLHDWATALPAGFSLWSLVRDSYLQNLAARPWTGTLLWLIGSAPLIFAVRQFISLAPIVPLYGLVVVSLLLTMRFKRMIGQPSGPAGQL